MERRLAAILLTDMVGYSRLMGLDEAGTIARQKTHREQIIDPRITAHSGRIVKTTGDGVLVEFPSVVNAVQCAVEVQQAVALSEADVPEQRRIQYRIGINLGDIAIDDDDILGDGVNVAARLEQLADPGGICIARNVFNLVTNKLDISFQDMGEQKLKNITEPVRAYRIIVGEKDERPAAVAMSDPPPLPDKPSIAVLPFVNMSSDPEQEFLSDGIAEDVITTLSRFRSLLVIAKNSSFSYKHQKASTTQIVDELGVRYLVEGSVRLAGSRVRISAQLTDASSGTHIWADRFDGELSDVFELQDRISENIVASVEPEILSRERARARRKPPESLDVWEMLQRADAHYKLINRDDYQESVRLFRKSIELDPEFASAYAHLSFALLANGGFAEDHNESVLETRRMADKALSLDRNDPLAHFCMGRLHLFTGSAEMAVGEMQTAIVINPNYAGGHFGLAYSLYYGVGEAEKSLEHFDAAQRLNPRNPMNWTTLHHKGSALRFLGRISEAIEHCRRSCQEPESGYAAYLQLGAALAEDGQTEEAERALLKARLLQPALSESFLRQHHSGTAPNVLKSLLSSLRKADFYSG